MLPMMCVIILMTYTSWYVLFVFLIEDSPEPTFLGKIWNYPRPLAALWYCYWMGMTYYFLFKACFRNPGYLPEWLKEPLIDNQFAPENLVRIYNMRTWMANGIYSFDKYKYDLSHKEI